MRERERVVFLRVFSSGEMKLHKYILACETFGVRGGRCVLEASLLDCSRSFSARCALEEKRVLVLQRKARSNYLSSTNLYQEYIQ